MTSLIYYTDPKQAFIATDTLAVIGSEAYLFITKAFYLPHLGTIIAGTGIGRFSDDWMLRVNTSLRVDGIESLDVETPELLRAQWADFQRELSGLQGKTTTIYHFGFSESTGEMTGFAYRSVNDFASERIAHGIGSKPGDVMPPGDELDIKAMMDEQRRLQSKVPADKRIYIGGDAMAIHLTRDRCIHEHLFRFPDYAEHAEQMRGR